MENSYAQAIEPNTFPWSVAVFASRESPDELISTLGAIVEAAAKPTVIDVMVNGNAELATKTTQQINRIQAPPGSVAIRVWSIPMAGKAHAWNQYLHRVWPGTRLAFFIDGYAKIKNDSLKRLEDGLSTNTDTLAGGGVLVTGRTASKLRERTLREGGIQGAFFVLKESAMNELRVKDFHLPLGLYGFDSLLGAVLSFGIDPSKNKWDAKSYIFLHPDITFSIDEKKWWRYSDIKTHFKRILNNGLRILVIGATRDYLARRKLPPEDLPRTVEEFVLTWVANCPEEAKKILRKSPTCRLALNKLRIAKDWSAAEKENELVYSSTGRHDFSR